MITCTQQGKDIIVDFKYDIKKVALIKRMPKSKYNPKNRSWCIPSKDLNILLKLFKDYKINLDVDDNCICDSTPQFDKQDIYSNFEFKTKPFDHQLDCFKYGIHHEKFLLGDEQGLGKTKQAIDIAVARKGQFKHCLIVCGVNSLKWNWLEEIKIHSHEKGHLIGGKWSKGKIPTLKDGTVKDRIKDLKEIDNIDSYFLVTNIETLRNKDIQKLLEKLTLDGTIGMTIIDEIHKAKNPQSQQGKAIHKLKSFYKIALTGTPLLNTPVDLYNVLKWLEEEYASFYRFRNRYCIMGGFGGYEVVGYKNLAELQNRVNSIMLRRLKKDVLDLPDKIYNIEYVEMNVKQRQIYKQVESVIKQDIDLIKSSPNPLAKLIRLRQATGYTGILSSTIKESAKFERLEELVEQITDSGHKVVVFSNWTSITDPVVKLLNKYNPGVITGDTQNRMGEVNKFQNDENCKVIVGTIPAMGTGLTLTAGSYVIFLDSPWTMGEKEQAVDRCHRIGTKSTVNVITLVCKNTIDEKIEQVVNKKGEISDVLIDNKMTPTNKSMLVDYLIS